MLFFRSRGCCVFEIYLRDLLVDVCLLVFWVVKVGLVGLSGRE